MSDSYTSIAHLLSTNDDNLSEQLTHVNREMYKKNLELTDRNKVLSVLRKIDETILNSVTDLEEISRRIANIVIEDIGFKSVFIFRVLKEQGAVVPLTISTTKEVLNLEIDLEKALHSLKFTLEEKDNIVIQTIQEKKMHLTNTLFAITKGHFSQDAARNIQQALSVTSLLVYPLVVRSEVIGSMVIGLDDGKKPMSQYEKWKDFVDRLPDVVAIAVNNALLYQEIQEANNKLKELDALKDEFVSVASHELRTPMTAIKSYLWMALAGKGGVISEKLRLYLDRAYNSTDRLIKLVNDMLNISRIESGRMSFHFAESNIIEMVNQMVDEVKPRADELGLTIIVEKANTILPTVLADKDKMSEVLINLVGNSLKFTPKGGTIKITFELNDETVVVHIADNGAGVTPNDLPRLFTKFGLMEHSYVHNKTSQGTGLGLYICKNIIDLHKGKIWAYSEVANKGAVFSFTLNKFNQKQLEEMNVKLKGKEGIDIIHSQL